MFLIGVFYDSPELIYARKYEPTWHKEWGIGCSMNRKTIYILFVGLRISFSCGFGIEGRYWCGMGNLEKDDIITGDRNG